MGVAADCVYVSKYGSTKAATEKILSDWNDASSLYKVRLSTTWFFEVLADQVSFDSHPSMFP